MGEGEGICYVAEYLACPDMLLFWLTFYLLKKDLGIGGGAGPMVKIPRQFFHIVQCIFFECFISCTFILFLQIVNVFHPVMI